MSSDNNKLKIDLFTTQFNQLINDLIELYPNDNSLTLLQTVANGMIFMNPNSFVKTTVDYLKPYNEKILIKDESFFLNEIIADFENHTFIADEIKKVHDIWIKPETSDATKQSIWKYFIFMVKLGKTIKF
jgi:hypothetical protein